MADHLASVTSGSSRPLRFGVVGVGFMGRQHADLIRRSPEAELVGVADPAVAPGSLDVPAYGVVGDLLDAQQLDAVVIANPNALHVDTAIECLARGTAVLVEKPVATSYADALRLATAVDELNGRLLVGHHRRHHPAIAAARAALTGGELGQVVAVSGMWSARKDDAYFADVPWHRERGAGVLLINLVHDLDLLRHLCGEVAEIQALSSDHARGLAVEDTVSVNLRFENGAVGSFLASDAGVSPWGWDQAVQDSAAFPYIPDGVAYQIVGTQGALSVPNLAKYTYDPAVPPDWHSPLSRTYLARGDGSSFGAQLDHFIDVARGSASPLVSAADAARTIALVGAAALAAEQRATVDVRMYELVTTEGP